MAEFLKKHAKGGGPVPGSGPSESCRWMSQHPALCEFLTLSSWEGGEIRETGTLLVCWGDGQFKAWINDRDSGRTAWLSGSTISELLDLVEERLRGDTLEWRAAGGSNGKKKLK